MGLNYQGMMILGNAGVGKVGSVFPHNQFAHIVLHVHWFCLIDTSLVFLICMIFFFSFLFLCFFVPAALLYFCLLLRVTSFVYLPVRSCNLKSAKIVPPSSSFIIIMARPSLCDFVEPQLQLLLPHHPVSNLPMLRLQQVLIYLPMILWIQQLCC